MRHTTVCAEAPPQARSLKRRRSACSTSRWRTRGVRCFERQARHAEAAPELAKLRRVDVPYQIHDRELARLGGDDHHALGVSLIPAKIDVDILVLASVVDRHHGGPDGSMELFEDRVHVSARVI